MTIYAPLTNESTSNGVWRRIWDDCVTFQPDYLRTDVAASWDYAVFKYPHVQGFHVCQFGAFDGDEAILSSHKTLHEAMGVLKVLLANGGVKYD